MTIIAMQGAMMAAGGVGPLDPDAVSIWPKIVAWYDHSETSGTTLVDSHASLNGTYNSTFSLNQPAIAAGLGPCMELTSSSGYTDVPYNAALDLPSTYSVMTWFRRTTDSQPGFAKILWKPTDVFTGRGTYYFAYEPGGNLVRFRFNSGGGYFDATATPIANNTTYCVVGTKLSAGSEIYVNATLANTQASGGTPDTSPSNLLQGSATGSDGMIGYYGPAALFNAPLTTSEVAYLYSGGSGVRYSTIKTQSGN